MRHFDLVDFESGRGEKRRQHRSVGEAFQRSSGSKDAEQDGAINFVRALISLGTMALSFQLRYPDGLLWFNAHRPDRGVVASFNSGCSLSPRCARTGYHP